MPNFNHSDIFSDFSRFVEITDMLSAGCDADFDSAYDDLEREFQELRLTQSRFH